MPLLSMSLSVAQCWDLSSLSAGPVFGRSQLLILLFSMYHALVIPIITSFSHLPIVFGRLSLGKIFGMSSGYS